MVAFHFRRQYVHQSTIVRDLWDLVETLLPPNPPCISHLAPALGVFCQMLQIILPR
jgi:hypothetical protein